MAYPSTSSSIGSMTPSGASLYMLIFLGILMITIVIYKESRIPEYMYVLALAAFTIWYIYVKLIAK